VRLSLRKAAWSSTTPPTSTGNPGYVGRTKTGRPGFPVRATIQVRVCVARLDPQFHKEYVHLCRNKPKAVAKVAAARKLAVRLYWMLRSEKSSQQAAHIESSPRVPLVGAS